MEKIGLPEMNYLFNKIRNIKRKLLLTPFPGSYSSPIVDAADIRSREAEIFSINSKDIPGVDLNEEYQLTLLKEFERYYPEIPFTDIKNERRYYYNNGYYLHSDAIFLYSMIRYFHPRRIVEIGAGFSSAAMLDSVDSLGYQDTVFTFIDPYPDRLRSVLRKEDHLRCTILEKRLEDVEVTIGDQLTENDILFVDSSHVCKTGSDVNKIILEILPRLNSRVLIHFHDLFFPFEYPKSWVLDWNSFGWNEDYFLRAFLMYNTNFEIVFFNTFLEQFYKERFMRIMPDCLKHPGGSLWIRKK
jgi:predicted O-methyltransferase YrrM